MPRFSEAQYRWFEEAITLGGHGAKIEIEKKIEKIERGIPLMVPTLIVRAYLTQNCFQCRFDFTASFIFQ